MIEPCCIEQKKTNDSLLTRSVIIILAGLLITIPIFETITLSFWSGYLFFIASTIFIGTSIYLDFPDYIGFISLLTFLAASILVISLYPLSLMSTLLLAISIPSSVLSLFVKNEKIQKTLLKMLFRYSPEKNESEANSYFELPSTRKLILMYVVICWTTSFASFFPAFNAIYSIIIQETFLIYGSYGISNHFLHTMQSKLLPHNHQSINLHKIIVGTVLKIEQRILIPASATALEVCQIDDNQSEKRIDIDIGETIPNNTFVHSGKIIFNESYQSTTHTEQRNQSENKDHKLNFILMTTFTFSLIMATYNGILLGSAAIGLKYLATNLIVACPCIFFTVKAIFNNKLLHWITQNTNIEFNKMPNSGKPNIMIFDRTHTLYEEDPNNPKGAYILNKNAIPLLNNLRVNGITCYILSGHSDKAHLKKCIRELKDVVSKDHIIFDDTFHDPDVSHKKEVVKNLQLYGRVDQPKSLLIRIKCYIQNLFSMNIVGMIGDGQNDVEAMIQSDFAVSISRDISNTDNDVLKAANFNTSQENLFEIYNLIEAIDTTTWYSHTFMTVGFFINISMLIITNGFIPSLAFISSSTACIFMPFVCISIMGISTLIDLNVNVLKSLNVVPINDYCRVTKALTFANNKNCKCCQHRSDEQSNNEFTNSMYPKKN
ncbi:MAG: hypothetical protein P8L77_03535 [Gammaproteobacteria bacterium]|nr:hypothetical protein [Gammaproteobacteria bacterium]